jgi:hypothetical protein
MTANLCVPVSNNFAKADSFKDLFIEEEAEKIKKDFLPREQPKLGVPGESCKTNLFFGFFFDGTKNNYELTDKNKEKTHSNIARLYDCYPGLSVPGVLPKETDWTYNPARYTHFFRVYVPGVASPLKEAHDSGKGLDYTLGAAIGNRGEARIVWALIQAVNNVHRYFKKKPLISTEETNDLLHKLKLDKTTLREMRPGSWGDLLRKKNEKDLETRAEFEKILQRLHSAISQHWVDKILGRPPKIDPGIVKKIYISIFGFSRGATQARAFSNWLVALCKLDAMLRGKGDTMTLGGFEVEFSFMGLFDTVASVGSANTFGNQWGLGGGNGHSAWADAEVSLRIPDNIPCVHLVAAHEVRRSFPLDSIAVNATLAGNCQEIVLPGVHSDLGGGYAPAEQGKGIDATGCEMLSRIPLIYMYRQARLAGVPLKLELANGVVKERFRVAPSTINAFNAYISKCETKAGSLTRIMREQRRYYIQWRLLRRATGKAPLESTGSYDRASQFDKNDLHSANLEFEKEIAEFERWLSAKEKAFQPKEQPPGFDQEHEREWEQIATWWRTVAPLSPEAATFFDEYVHDSRAWFKLVPGNPDSEADMHAKLREWVAARRRVKAFNDAEDKRAAEAAAIHRTGSGYSYGSGAYVPRYMPDGLTPEQRRAADEYERTNQIPAMLTEGREPYERSAGVLYLSAKAGYLRYRKVYAGGDNLLVSQKPSSVSEGGTLAA